MSKTITICASVSFYKEVIEAMHFLEKKDFKVLVPDLALEMEKTGDYDKEAYREKYDSSAPDVKRALMDTHFAKIKKSDAVLIINLQKHEVDGYIGANVLMEMTAAYLFDKQIFILNSLPESLSSYDEIMALRPIFLDGQLNKMTLSSHSFNQD